MKKLKVVFSIILSVFMMLNLISIFASAEERTVSWEDFDENLVYSGELKLGTNTFDVEGKFAFDFIAEKEGVYAINFTVDEAGDEYGYSTSISENIVDGNPVDSKCPVDSDDFGSLYYFEKDEKQFYGLITEGDISTYSVDIQYLGKVKDFSLVSNDLQAGFDIDIYEDESNSICEIYAPICVTTEEEIEFTVSYLAFSLEEQNLDSGEYSAVASVFNCEKEISFNVYRAFDFVKAIKPNENYTEPVVTLDENGEIESYSSDEGSFAVDFELTDGTVITNNSENQSFELTLEDGKVIRFLCDVIEGEDGNYYWTAYVGSDSITISKAKINENSNPDVPDDPEEENFFISLYKWIVKLIGMVITFIKSLYTTKAF